MSKSNPLRSGSVPLRSGSVPKKAISLAATFALALSACGTGDSNETNAVAADASITETTLSSAAPAGSDNGTASASGTASAEAAIAGIASSGPLGRSLLAKTLDADSAEATSARFSGNFILTGGPTSEMPGEISILVEGAYDLAAESSDLSIDFSQIMTAALAAAGSGSDEDLGLDLFSGFLDEPMRIITIGDQAWLNWSMFSLFSGGEGAWIETEAGDTEDLTSSFGFGGQSSPTAFLESLREANAEIEEVGREEVRGVDTTHYRAMIDTEQLEATMTPEEKAEFETGLGGTSVTELPMEFWVDDDGLLRRYRIDLSDPSVLAESDGELERFELVFELYDYGVDLGIQPPPADEIVSSDEFDFGDFGN